MKATSAEMEKASAQMKQQMESMPPAVREKMEKMMGGAADVRDRDQGRHPQGRRLRLPGVHDRHGPGA